MSVMQQLPKDHPMYQAWEQYSQTPEYSNTRSWALHEQHVDGSLWAAFCAGYNTAPKAEQAAPAIYGLRSALTGEWDGKTTVKASDADLYDESALLPLYAAPPAQPQEVEIPGELPYAGEPCSICGCKGITDDEGSDDYCPHNIYVDHYVNGWNECRAAMRATQAPAQPDLRERCEALEDVLRSLACHVSAGGYNAPDPIDPKAFEEKIKWGIDHLLEHKPQAPAQVPSPTPTDREGA